MVDGIDVSNIYIVIVLCGFQELHFVVAILWCM